MTLPPPAWTLQDTKDVFSMFASLSVILAAASYALSRRVAWATHERSRREKSIALIAEYTKGMDSQRSAAMLLIEKLSDHDIDALDAGESFSIPVRRYELLYAAIPKVIDAKAIAPTEGAETYTLTRRESYALRWQIIGDLNALEVVAQSWKIGVADCESIEEQLNFLLLPQRNQNILTRCRTLADLKSYPALHLLIEAMEKARPIPPPRSGVFP